MKVEHWDFKDAYFGALLPFVQDENITDINYNGTDVWVEHLQQGIYKTDVQLSEEFVVQFSLKVSNLVSDQINKYQNVLEAETDTLRISIIHPSVTNTGWSISIRKTPTVIRLQEERMIREGYCTKEILEVLKQCMRQKYNMVFCGTPGAGKTELLKYLTQFIPREEKVMTIEDNLEIHYKEINPGANCVELKVDEQLFSYTKAIKTMLRQNPKWVLLSEARSTEVRYLMECFSTGVHGLTTLHADDVRKIPDRIANMSRDEFSMRMMNDVYSFIQVGVLLRKIVLGNQRIIRRIEQIAFFERVNGENHVHMVVEDGKLLGIPTQWKERWERSETQEKQRSTILSQSEEFKKSGTRLWW